MTDTRDRVFNEIATIQRRAREHGDTRRPRWPMIILRTPKGWTGPKTVNGKPCEDTWRSHQVPFLDMATNRKHIRLLESWMKSYRPRELFDSRGRLRQELLDLAPCAQRRMSANPHINGGLLLKDLRIPDFPQFCGTGDATRSCRR